VSGESDPSPADLISVVANLKWRELAKVLLFMRLGPRLPTGRTRLRQMRPALVVIVTLTVTVTIQHAQEAAKIIADILTALRV
jgi:hypothetical protein